MKLVQQAFPDRISPAEFHRELTDRTARIRRNSTEIPNPSVLRRQVHIRIQAVSRPVSVFFLHFFHFYNPRMLGWATAIWEINLFLLIEQTAHHFLLPLYLDLINHAPIPLNFLIQPNILFRHSSELISHLPILDLLLFQFLIRPQHLSLHIAHKHILIKLMNLTRLHLCPRPCTHPRVWIVRRWTEQLFTILLLPR